MLWINLGNTISKRQHGAHMLALAAQSPSPLSGINGCGPPPSCPVSGKHQCVFFFEGAAVTESWVER